MKIYFYWSDVYAKYVSKYCKDGPMFNVSIHMFTSFEIKSLRNTEVIFLPANPAEIALAEKVQHMCNKYGVVSAIKNIYQLM